MNQETEIYQWCLKEMRQNKQGYFDENGFNYELLAFTCYQDLEEKTDWEDPPMIYIEVASKFTP